jgi:hypothetical protein
MTIEQYLAQLRKYGLTKTHARSGNYTFYETADGDKVPVRNPEDLTDQQRQETIDRLKKTLGVDLPGYRQQH